MESVKIKKIDVENLKAVSQFTAIFDGKSAHVTGANGIGKSTVIRAFTDRLRGLKPSIITKIGEVKGKTVMELTDGCRFEWTYNNEGKDFLNYFTPNTVKPVRRDVFKHICGQYFPNQFDINKFLTTTEPAKRLKMISELVNVDLTNVHLKYKNAFEIRADAKKELKVLEAQIKPKPETQTFEGLNSDIEQKEVNGIKEEIDNKKEALEIERNSLNSAYTENKKANDLKIHANNEGYKKKLDSWFKSEAEKEAKATAWNKSQEFKKVDIDENIDLLNSVFEICKNTFLDEFFDAKEADNFIKAMPTPLELKTFTPNKKPELKSLNLPDPMPSSEKLLTIKSDLITLETDFNIAIETLEQKKEELSDLNASKQVYDLQLKQFAAYQNEVTKQVDYVQDCETDVFKILDEIKTIISSTKLPDDFIIDLTNKNDILFRTSKNAEYLPITNETLASSAIFIAAFKLQANYLEAFRVAHFDVSYLDYENRAKVLKEAVNMNIQLITESPAHDENSRELQYKIYENE